MESKLTVFFHLFLTFLKISPITFGGGYAMIPLIEREVVQKYGWLDEKEIVDVFTVAQSAPGAVAINAAIFIGYRIAGFVGSIVALLGIILPTLIIVIIAVLFYTFFNTNPIVRAALNGIGMAVIALIIHAGYKVGKTAMTDKLTFIIGLVSFLVLIIFNTNPILVILVGGILGIIISKIKLR